jgi:hypothetical protein
MYENPSVCWLGSLIYWKNGVKIYIEGYAKIPVSKMPDNTAFLYIEDHY